MVGKQKNGIWTVVLLILINFSPLLSQNVFLFAENVNYFSSTLADDQDNNTLGHLRSGNTDFESSECESNCGTEDSYKLIYSDGGFWNHIVTGDADGDGNMDLYHINSTGKVKITEFDNLIPTTSSFIDTDRTFPRDLGDIDHDGKADLLLQRGEPSWGGHSLLIYESSSSTSLPNNFRSSTRFGPGWNGLTYPKMVDIDGDGFDEVIMCLMGIGVSPKFFLMEWDDSGDSLVQRLEIDIESRNIHLPVADFDGDGDMEFAFVKNHDSVFVYESGANDSYKYKTAITFPFKTNISGTRLGPVTDFDGGGPELVVWTNSTGNNTISIYKASGNTFTLWNSFSFKKDGGNRHTMWTSGDFDGDGYDEIVFKLKNKIRILEYIDGAIDTTWSAYIPTNLITMATADLRLNSVDNFIGTFHDTIRIFEVDWVTEAPSKPKTFNIFVNGSDHATLTWDKNTEPDLKDYMIKRGGTWIATVAGTIEDPNYSDKAFTMGSGPNKTYELFARDDSLNLSPAASMTVTWNLEAAKMTSGNEVVPNKMVLFQNNPNPFNPSTNIRFGIPEDGNVQLRIYDLRGRLVKNLLSSNLKAGYHSAAWNGTNNFNRSVSAGMYIYKIESEHKSVVKKLLLIK